MPTWGIWWWWRSAPLSHRSCIDVTRSRRCRVNLEYWHNRRCNLQAKAHCPRHVGLPLGTEEHEHSHETTEEHPVRVQTYSTGNTRSHGNKDWRQRNATDDGNLTAVQIKSNRWLLQFQSTCGEGIAAVVKDLPQGRGAVSSPGLLPIDGIKRLVKEEAECTQHKGPRWSLDVRK